MKVQQKPTKRSAKKQIHLVIPAKPAPTPAPVEPSSAKVEDVSVAARIADQLQETKHYPRKQIRRIVWALGDDQAQRLAQRAMDIDAGPGMLINNGKRRRTAGGIFFALAYSEGKPIEGHELVRPAWTPGRKKKPVQAESEQAIAGQA